MVGFDYGFASAQDDEVGVVPNTAILQTTTFLNRKTKMKILAIESSCDETSAAVVLMDNGGDTRKILSNKIATSVEMHALYGGVVPEIASRAHAEAISGLAYEALREAGTDMDGIDAIAVTAKPGLIGALLVGVNFAKSLAFAYNKPLIPVNHIMGHIAACYFEYPELKPPFFAMVASGGHSSFIKVDSYTEAHTVGRTRDDAVGECFDKVARVMGMPYPGGAEMDRLAYKGNPDAIKFPSAAIIGDTLDLSFSGIKTSVLNYLNSANQKGLPVCHEDVAASFTKTVCTSIIKRLEDAHKIYKFKSFVLAGGVSANSHLRRAVEEFGKKRGVKVYMPPLGLCSDNGAMIGAQGYFEFLQGNLASEDLNPVASCIL